MDASEPTPTDGQESTGSIDSDPDEWIFQSDAWVGQIDTPFFGSTPLDTVHDGGEAVVEVRPLVGQMTPLCVEIMHDEPEMYVGVTAKLTAAQADKLADRLQRQAAAARSADES